MPAVASTIDAVLITSNATFTPQFDPGEAAPSQDVLDLPVITDLDYSQTDIVTRNGSSDIRHIRMEDFLPVTAVLPPPTEFFRAMQKWEGYVIAVDGDTFRASLTPIVGELGDLETEIYVDEVAEDERDLLEPGAVFYWSIGYLDRPSGRVRSSLLRFRRLLSLSKQEISRAKERARLLQSVINDDNTHRPAT